jgi:hypothetical protein
MHVFSTERSFFQIEFFSMIKKKIEVKLHFNFENLVHNLSQKRDSNPKNNFDKDMVDYIREILGRQGVNDLGRTSDDLDARNLEESDYNENHSLQEETPQTIRTEDQATQRSKKILLTHGIK